jgi:tetratricopeptide (TPR) repeat protein
MAKTPTKKKPAKGAQPDAAQLKAVERLMDAGDHAHAIERARALVARFPDHGGARRLLLDALMRGGVRSAAPLAAYQWAQRRPNSLPAQEELVRLAVESGHLFLADRVAARIGDLGGTMPTFILAAKDRDKLLLQPDGSPATPADMERCDIGKLHLAGQDFLGAIRELDGIAATPARNDRALALFHLGRIEAALDAFMDAWQADPDNLFALGWVLRLRLWRGDEDGARGLAVPLGQAQAWRGEDARAQLLALLLIQDNHAAWDAFERSVGADGAQGEPRALRATWLHLGACAASRLGRGDRARALWREALDLNPSLRAAQLNLSVLDEEGVTPAYPQLPDQSQVVPMTWVQALRAAGEDGPEPRLDELTASNAYLEAIYLGGDLAVRQLVAMLFARRLQAQPEARQGQRGVPAILRDLAKRPIGTSQERLGFLTGLRKVGLIAPDEAVQFWSGGELRQVRVVDTEIVRGPEPSDLPEDLQPLLEKSIVLHREGRLDDSEAALAVILARVPGHQVALGNLAAIRAAQGRGREAREVLRQAIAIHPDYLFARCNLASLLIQDGALDEAQGLLAGLSQRPRLHLSDVFVLYGAMAMLNRARGEDEAAEALISTLDQMTEDEDDERLLAQAKARVERATPAGRFRATLRSMLKIRPRPYKPKRR